MAYNKKINEEFQVEIDDLEVFPEELDFDEFDKVVTKSQITVATKDDEEDDIEIGEDEFDIEDLEVMVDDDIEEVPEDKEEEIVDDKEEEVIEDSVKKKGKSILEVYESRQKRSMNPIVESVLCDNTVDTIANALQSTMRAHGIPKAQSFAVLGIILDKMLHASDEDVASEEFISSVVGELVTADDLKSIIIGAIEHAISGENIDIGAIEKEVGEEPVSVETDDEE